MKKAGKKRILITVALSALAILLVIAGTLHLATGGTVFNRGARNLLTRMNENGDTPDFSFESGMEQTQAVLGDGLAVANTVGVTCYDKNGNVFDSETMILSQPVFSTSEDYVLLYDMGGTCLRLLNSSGITASAETEAAIICASVSEDGYFAVCTEESGYKGSVTVCRPDGTAIYKWYSGSGYVTSARTANNGKQLYVSALTDMGSCVYMFDTDSEETRMECSLDGEMIISVWAASKNSVIAVSDRAAFSIDDDGVVKELYTFDERTLTSFARADGYTVLVLSSSAALADGTLVVVTDSGSVLEGESGEAPLGVSVSGKYIAVLRIAGVEVYNKTLDAVAELTENTGAKSVLMRQDGTLILVTSHRADIYDAT